MDPKLGMFHAHYNIPLQRGPLIIQIAPVELAFTQILYLNLFNDTFPTVLIGVELENNY
jgi:hypothetical protein